ncbi:MAG: hypothetical protein ACC660_06895 [Acidimicrobiales bacterium]
MTQDGLRLVLDADVTECGDTLTGQLEWGALQPAPRNIVVSLRFTTDGRAKPPDSGGPDPVTIDTRGSDSARFEFPVPLLGPITFSGSTISVNWEVEAQVDGAAAPSAAVSQTVTVLPKGGLAMWARQTAPPPHQTDDLAE